INEDLDNRRGMASSYAQLGLHAEARNDTGQALAWTIRCVALFDEVPHPRTGTGPGHLRQLTARLGIEAVERAWQRVTDRPLPPAVRAFLLTAPID
ncbi:hypothetical protein ABZS96_20870, partial [Streptomyces avermitilis]|uniref:hypothetical protein n=1 Tax=Streptomyces avermitilis TaxID=33903 RepID=UPI0033B8FB4B